MQPRAPERDSQSSMTSLVFPTYNPGAIIDRTWRGVQRFLEDAPGNWEILFVCDGCTDGTPDVLARLLPSAGTRVRLVSYNPNRGKGYAVRRGLLEARGQWRLFTDVDLAYGFDDVLRLAKALHDGAGVAIGSRLHPESRLVLPPHLQGYALRRHLQSQVFSALARWLLPIAQRDTQAGLKGMSAAVARLLLPHLRCDGFDFDCELLTACARLGVAVTEVPVCVRYETTASTTGLASVVRMVRALWKIRGAWRHGPPAGIRAPGPAEVRHAA
jgi:dolichyl-phosphate beta-glucosyltransferase